MNRTHLASSLILGLLAPLAACTTVIDAAPAGNNGGDAGSSPTGNGPLIPKSELGGDCAFGCEPGVACAAPDDSCPDHFCVFDGREGSTPAATCTAACDNATCPDGYTCDTVAHSSSKVCVPKPGRCGDGEIQGKENCDDGNVLDFDACSKDCSKGPTALNYALLFGDDNSGTHSQALFSGPMPTPGDADGCGKVTIAQSGTDLIFTMALCDAKTKEKARLLWRIPNKVGDAQVTLPDFQVYFTAGAAAEQIYEPQNCSNCGVKITVSSAWGSPTGFSAMIESYLTRQGTTFGGYSVRGSLSVVPGHSGM